MTVAVTSPLWIFDSRPLASVLLCEDAFGKVECIDIELLKLSDLMLPSFCTPSSK